MRAIVVGAGIGGLAAAIGLGRSGHEVVLLERAQEIHGLGAGISLWPNAVNALGRLGLRDAVLGIGAPVRQGAIHSWRGDVLLADDPATFQERFGAPLVVVHRAELHRVLLGCLDAGVLRTDAEVVGVEQDDAGVTVHLADGSAEAGDLLVGADGIRSTVRAAVLRDGPPRFAGATAWRTITPLAAGLLARTSDGEYWGRGRLFGIVRLSPDSAYLFAAARAREGDRAAPEQEKAALLESFGGWADPIAALIEATPPEVILRHDLYDRPPSGPWGKKRVTLLGDAAHPMLPNLGQGACQAIEDAAALTDALRPGTPRPDDAIPVETDLRAYESARMARAHAVVRQSRRMGRMALLDGALAQGARNLVMRSLPRRAREREAAKILGG